MQLISLISAATAIVATASARTAVTLNKECNQARPYARIINRCDYPVHLWSVLRGTGCPSDGMVTLQTGETYSENYDNATDATGVSIKISKTENCKGSDIVQLEYYLETTKPEFDFNYLDVSYVDCLGNDCPTKSEGYYLVAGNQTGDAKASAGNTWCPILSCHDAVSCAKMSYILPDDVQTKTCGRDQNMDFYMCGGEAPTEDYDSSPAPASSSKQAEYSAPAATSVQDSYETTGPAPTTPPVVPDVQNPSKTTTHVEVVYVTAYEYVNAKRHAHGHARRHQQFHA